MNPLRLDIGKEVLEALPPAAVSDRPLPVRQSLADFGCTIDLQRAIDGLFQAISTRTAGFAIVGLGTIAPALQFLYVVMMVRDVPLQQYGRA